MSIPLKLLMVAKFLASQTLNAPRLLTVSGSIKIPTKHNLLIQPSTASNGSMMIPQMTARPAYILNTIKYTTSSLNNGVVVLEITVYQETLVVPKDSTIVLIAKTAKPPTPNIQEMALLPLISALTPVVTDQYPIPETHI